MNPPTSADAAAKAFNMLGAAMAKPKATADENLARAIETGTPVAGNDKQREELVRAAAFDLLEACKAMLDADADSFVDAGTTDHHRTDHVCLGCGSSYEHGEGCPIQMIRAAIAKATGGAA